METNAKHTPGPWAVNQNHLFPRMQVHNNKTGLGIAEIYPIKYGDGRAETEANARLIAAAPDLLEALLKLGAFIETLPMTGDVAQLACVKDLAISKATGCAHAWGAVAEATGRAA